MKILLCLLGLGLVCGGCASVSPRQYEKDKPVLNRYLNGPLDAWGMFQNRKGEVVKRFHVKLLGTWSNNVGTLEEDEVRSRRACQRTEISR